MVAPYWRRISACAPLAQADAGDQPAGLSSPVRTVCVGDAFFEDVESLHQIGHLARGDVFEASMKTLAACPPMPGTAWARSGSP